MYLTESERKRIKGLYEASSASGAGSYETPMGFKAERPETIGELPDEMDMGISDDEGITIDVDELMDMLALSEEGDKERMRQLHKDNSVVAEQELPEIPEVCLTCLTNAIPEDLQTDADKAVELVYEIITTGEVDIDKAKKVLMSTLKINMYTAGKIGWAMLGCVDKCKPPKDDIPI